MALGQILKEARESKDLTVSEVAVITRMTSQIVSEIENEDFHRFTAELYWKSYIKLYAETMGLDPTPLVEEFVNIFEGRKQPKPVEEKKPKPAKKRDYNIFPTGETALEKIEKKNYSENINSMKNKVVELASKALPVLKDTAVKCRALCRTAFRQSIEFCKEVKPLYLYSSIGVVCCIILVFIGVSSLKSYRDKHPKQRTEKVVVSEMRIGVKLPEPYYK